MYEGIVYSTGNIVRTKTIPLPPYHRLFLKSIVKVKSDAGTKINVLINSNDYILQ